MTEWLPSLNALRAFEAVSRHLSYRKAAAELHVTPAAVKQLVQSLERSLDRSLVTRQGRGLALTEVAMTGLADLHEAFDRLHRTVAKMRRAERRASLTITVEPSFAAAWLMKRLQAFKARCPDVDVLIEASMRPVDLAREETDIWIRYGGTAEPGHVTHRLFDEEFLPVCAPGLAAGPPPIACLGDLGTATLIEIDMSLWPTECLDWESWLRALGAEEIGSGRRMRFNDYTVALHAAIAGQGVLLGSRPIVQDALDAGLLVAPIGESVKIQLGYDVVATKEALERAEVAAFVDWIRAAASPDGTTDATVNATESPVSA
jgi:LysR family transcriptional regulator, glycine cleavage system transcriptional activator